MTDPFSTLATTIAELVVSSLREAGSVSAAEDEALASLRTELDPWRPYTAAEVGRMIGLEAKSVHGIDPELLRPVYTGPAGKRKRYIGINVLMYILGQEPVDTEQIGQRVREQFLASAGQPATVRMMPGAAQRRRIV
jgi:hypothetical protein